MARRLPVVARSSVREDAAPRCARARRSVVPAPLLSGRAVRTESCLAAHRPVSDEPSFRHQRHAARSSSRELGADRARRRLRSGAVRLHRHQSRSARLSRRSSGANDLRRGVAGLCASKRCSRPTSARGCNGCASAARRFPPPTIRSVFPENRPGRVRERRAGSRAAAVAKPSARHVLHDRSGDRLRVRPARAVVCASVAAAATPAVDRAGAISRALRA